MRASLIPALAALSVSAVPAAAQVTHDGAVWVNVTAMGPIEKDLVYFAEIQPRVTENASHLGQLLLRGAIGVKLSPAMTLYQGYAHIEEPGFRNARDRNEERSFQQLNWSLHKQGRSDFSSRTRFEQRWRSDASGMALRLREMLRYEHALGNGTRRPGLLGYAEAFVGVRNGGWAEDGFDQLRSFVGVALPVAGKTTVEAGYLNQLRDAAGGRANMAHVASLSVFIRH